MFGLSIPIPKAFVLTINGMRLLLKFSANSRFFCSQSLDLSDSPPAFHRRPA